MSGNPRKRQLVNELSIDDNNNGIEEEVINDHNIAADIDADDDTNGNANEHEQDDNSVINNEENHHEGSRHNGNDDNNDEGEAIHDDDDDDDDDDRNDANSDEDSHNGNDNNNDEDVDIDDNYHINNANDDDDSDESSDDNPWDNCTLQQAIEEEEPIETIMELIELLPLEVKHRNRSGAYPLHTACRYGHNLLVMKLIELFPEAARHNTPHGMYPLHLACQFYQSEDVVIRLIETFPKAVIKSAIEGTVLHLACRSTNISETIIRKLIKINPLALQEKDHEGKYPIYHAIENGQPIAIVTLLFDGDPLGMNQRHEFNLRCNNDLFRIACETNNAAFISYFMQRSDHHINKTDSKGKTPLHYACEHLRDEIVEVMFQYSDIDVNATNNCNDTPLHTLMKSSDTYFRSKWCHNILRKLLDHPFILIDQKNNDGKTPLDLIEDYWNKIKETEEGLIDEGQGVIEVSRVLEEFSIKKRWHAYCYHAKNFEDL